MSEATFTAARLDEAMNLVKKALGADAFILSTRKVELGGARRFEVRATRTPPETLSASALIPPEETSERSPLEKRLIEAGVLENEGPPVERRVHVMERLLRENHVDGEHIQKLVPLMGLPGRTMSERREQLLRVIRQNVGFGERAKSRIVAVVGPTGVGKTTTIAKLAARDIFTQGLRVGLISLDQYRIGGADQLARYADLMGAPFASAADASSLVASVREFSSFDRIYLDTAGRAPRDRQAYLELAQMLRSLNERVTTHLAMTASTRQAELSLVLERHSPLEPGSLLMTKLDEAVYFGGVVSAAMRTGLPLAWFTTGQRVPEDIENASAELLTDALLGDDLPSESAAGGHRPADREPVRNVV